jgi:hypothetical protein
MFKNINCIFAENPGGYCKNKNIKRSLFGLGPRICKIYWKNSFDSNKCEFRKKIPRPNVLHKEN